MSADRASYADAVAAWTHHLREGGTTPWDPRRWSVAAGSEPAGPPPSALHLELLRRLTLAARAAGQPAVPPGLAEVVLTTARPGRGLVDPPLPWPDHPGFGSPALDPATLRPELLVRLGAGVVVRLLSGVPDPAPTPVRPSRRPWPWRTAFVLHGPRPLTAPVRARLLDAGAVEGGRRAVHLVLGAPLETAMAEHWAGRVAGGGMLTWTALWRRAASADRLPDPVDVDRTAEQLAAEHPGRVRVLLAAGSGALATLALGTLGVEDRTEDPAPASSPARWDLQRRVNLLAPLARGPVTGPRLARRLAPVLDEVVAARADDPAPAWVPAAYLPWARDAAADLAGRVAEGGYPVHGDPGLIVRPTPRSGTRTDGSGRDAVDRRQTLDLTLAACLRLWRPPGGTP